MAKKSKGAFVSVAGLKRRGWTDALIQRFLGEPDKVAPNPMYRSGAPMRLYAEARALKFEAKPEFVRAKERQGPRREAARRAVVTKRARTLEEARTWPVHVPIMPLGELAERARAHYEDRQAERAWDEDVVSARFPLWPAPSAFRDRIVVNYLRHEVLPYEDALDAAVGRVGRDEVREVVFRRCMSAVASAYAVLAVEAERQVQERFARLVG